MRRANRGGRKDILINSVELYLSIGGCLGSVDGMALCCDSMQAEMKLGDTKLLDRSSGAGMTVRYLLPRVSFTSPKGKTRLVGRAET